MGPFCVRQKKVVISFYICFGIITLLMTARTFFGVEITDEAYYVAEGKTVFEGNIPFSLNNSNAVGQTFLMIPFVWLFSLFSPKYSGYFLYMRLCFVLTKSIILVLCFYKLKKHLGAFQSACTILIMGGYHLYSIQNFSYNNIPVFLLFFIEVSLYDYLFADYSIRKKNIGYFVCGFLSAIAVFAHPAQAITVVYLVILLMVLKIGKRGIMSYIFGGIVQIGFLFSIIIFKSGVSNTLQGLLWYQENLGSVERLSFSKSLSIIIGLYWKLWGVMALSFVCSILISVSFMLFRKRGLVVDEFRYNLVRIRVIDYSVIFSVIVGMCYVIFGVGDQEIVCFIGACSVFVFVLFLFFFPSNIIVWFIGVPGILFCMFESFFSATNSPASRFVFAVPMLAAFFLICIDQDNKMVRIKGKEDKLENLNTKRFVMALKLAILATTMLILFCEMKGLRYVYRDSNFSELTHRVDQGVFKGIFTTEKMSRDTIELETLIKELTCEGELIAFRDNVPIGYLFMNGSICDIRTWDCMQYSYGKNDPSALFSYYRRLGSIPDKIIYVDFGRDEELSIYSEGYLYNDFVKRNYDLVYDERLNDTFKKVIVYSKK